MCRKSPAVSYYARKIKTSNKKLLIQELEIAPLRKIEFNFMLDVLEGLSYKELAIKYNKSEKRIYQIKHDLFIRLHQFDMQNLR